MVVLCLSLFRRGNVMIHNEDSRVKIPSLLHLTRLGYEYLSLKNAFWDKQSNIFTQIFQECIAQINHIPQKEAKRVVDEVTLLLDNNDLGYAFYQSRFT